MAIRNGDLADADSLLNNVVGTQFRNTAQLLYNSSLIGFNSKLNAATGVPNLKNIKYDVFNSDTATFFFNMEYDGTDKLWKTNQPNPVVIIEASSLSSTFTDNDCLVKQINSGSWMVYCTTGDNEVRRAKIMNTLFLTGGGRISRFSSITAVRTNVARDIGKNAIYVTGRKTYAAYGDGTGSITGTFTTTSDNNSVSSWSNCSAREGPSGEGYWSIPSGTARNYAGGNHFNTDRTGDETNNPATCVLSLWNGSHDYPSSGTAQALIITKGDIEFAASNINLASEKHWVTDGVPSFSAITSRDNAVLTFQTTDLEEIKDCIATWNAEIDPANTLTVSISADGTNYEEVNDATLHRFTNTGTNLYVKFEIDRVIPSEVDKISEYAILYNISGIE